MRKLGETQKSVLESLKRHRGWNPGCGWIWDNGYNTRRVMESLVARGLVTKEGNKYSVNEHGDAVLAELYPVQYGALKK